MNTVIQPELSPPLAGKTNILIAERNPVIARALVDIITTNRNLHVIGSTSDPDTVYQGLRQYKIDLLTLDSAFRNAYGLNVLQMALVFQPDLKVLMLAEEIESNFAIQALAYGAKGFFEKGQDLQNLEQAIKQIIDGGTYWTEQALAKHKRFLRKRSEKIRFPYDLLTDQELDIFRHMGEGKSFRQIAQILQIEKKRLSHIRLNMRRKMGASNITDLTKMSVDWISI